MNDDELNQLLQQVPDPQPSASLLRAVAEIPLRHPRPTGWGAWLPFGMLRTLVTAALVTALGVSMGLMTASPVEADDDWEDLAALTFGDGYLNEDSL